jgi:peptide/nickel transport system substrate-binding protein
VRVPRGVPEHSGLTRQDFLRRAAAAGIVLGAAGSVNSLLDAAPAATGGDTLRIGASGGSALDIVDGQAAVTRPDQARLLAGWESLATFDSRNRFSLDGLAEEITPNAAGTVWTIRVRDGIEFHNGKTLSAEDVRYSLQRLVDPRLVRQGLYAGFELTAVDPRRIRKLDRRTVRLTLKRPEATMPDGLAQFVAGIVPAGYSPRRIGRANPNVGTGPYVLQSFVPGEKSVHVRNRNYWRTDVPGFDRVVVIDIPDDTARVAALLAGQVDAITDVPPSQVAVIERSGHAKVLEAPSGSWTPLCMRVDVPPFDDVRVRRAFRLIADRPALVEHALGGHGWVGNDLYAPFDEDVAAFPQRVQDLERARSLLRAAGRDGLVVDLQTVDSVRGMNEGAEVFARQAKGAGVTVRVRKLNPGTFYSRKYLSWPFSTDFWGPRNYLFQVEAGSLPTSNANETHWPPSRSFVTLYEHARRTVARARRRELIRAMMQSEYESGGYIVWGLTTTLDAYSNQLTGLEATDRGIVSLNNFGHGFRTISFA